MWFSDDLVDRVVSCGEVAAGDSVHGLVPVSAPLVPETELSTGTSPATSASATDPLRGSWTATNYRVA
jgi:hypothetical protein